MALADPKHKNQLGFDEYVEEWRSLIALFYFRALHPELTEQGLRLNSMSVVGYSMELSAVLIYIAMSNWEQSRDVPAESKERVSSVVVEQFYKDLHNGLSPKSQSEWIALYKNRQDAFSRVYHNLISPELEKRREDIYAMTSELVGRVSSGREAQDPRVIKRIGNIFLLAGSAFKDLTEHTEPDAEVVRGKPRFIISKQITPNIVASRWDR